MKRISLALLFPTLLAANIAEAVTVYNNKGTQLDIYGRIEAQVGNEWTSDQTNATNLTGRLGFEAKTKLDEQFGLFGKLEWQVNTQKNDTKNSNDNWDIRYSYVGIDGKDLGKLMVGRTRNPMYQWMGITDRYMNYTANVYSNWVGTRIDSSYQWNRQDGTLQYEYTNGGLDLRTAYVMGNGASSSTVEDGYMASLGYAFEFPIAGTPLKIKPVVAWQKMTKDPKDTSLSGYYTNYVQKGAGVRLNYGQAYLGINVGKQTYERAGNRADRNFDSFDSLAEYWFTKKIALRGGYSQLIESEDDYVHRKQWVSELEYRVLRNVHLSATYIYDDRESYDSAENLWVLGLRYEF
ncbi:putative porin [Serratia fonticola]|jgi:predicted porin|uniref:Putative porin n=1 Tax=Serratia fonticola TaxID=47917 RepID=A0A542D684_SERFO|nr:porin [Serratia fonticola]TQI79420.1 putative porin [Serratia fonticola]TQI98555.1 putative porin [Serratia fonticola]TVZ68083.1 putative porin [Serratia fonticola]